MTSKPRSYLLIAAACQLALLACDQTARNSDSATNSNISVNVNGNGNGNGNNNTVLDVGNVTYYRDVKPIATAKCATCHDAGGIGPFTLTSFQDWNGKMASIDSDVAAELMPPWMPADGCSTYNDDLSLTADEKTVIAQWVKLGGPQGDPNDYVAPAASALPVFRTDTTLTMPRAFQVQTSPDQYRCFVLPWSRTTTKYVTGFGIRPGNASIVHHAIVDIVSASSASATMAKDGTDGSPDGIAGNKAPASIGWRCGPLAGWRGRLVRATPSVPSSSLMTCW